MLRQVTAEEIYIIIKEYTFYADLFSLTLGTIGNLLIILVLSNLRIFRGNKSAFYLMIESISNIGLILTMSPSNIVSYKINQELTYISLIWCKLKATFGQIFALCSVYTICFLTFDQYLSTNHRYPLRQMSTLKLAHRLTIFNICFTFFHSLLFLIFNEIQSTFTCAIYNVIFKKYLSFFYYPILSSALPIIVCSIYGLLAYYNVRRLVRRQIPIVRRRLDHQFTAMILARVLCLIILGLPYIFYSLYQLNLSFTGDNYMEIAIVSLTGSISYSLVYANFSITFYIFLFISSRFRRQVKQFLVKQWWRSLELLCCTRTVHLNGNQVVPEAMVERPMSIIESV